MDVIYVKEKESDENNIYLTVNDTEVWKIEGKGMEKILEKKYKKVRKQTSVA